jgi:transcriptional regulator with XRE-family HTH domain
MSEFRKEKTRVRVSPGESVRIMRELQELSQNQLAEATGIPQSTISAIERERVNLGVERAKVLARALKCHPAVLVFPGWDASAESAAYKSRLTDASRRSSKR